MSPHVAELDSDQKKLQMKMQIPINEKMEQDLELAPLVYEL